MDKYKITYLLDNNIPHYFQKLRINPCIEFLKCIFSELKIKNVIITF